jgi:hypothetical protein
MFPCIVQGLHIWFSQQAFCVYLHTTEGLIFLVKASCVLCDVKTEILYEFKRSNFKRCRAVSPELGRWPTTKEVYLTFVVDKAEQRRDFITLFLFCPFTVITSVHHTWLHLHGAVFRRKAEGVRWILILKRGFSRNLEHDTEVYL